MKHSWIVKEETSALTFKVGCAYLSKDDDVILGQMLVGNSIMGTMLTGAKKGIYDSVRLSDIVREFRGEITLKF